MEEYEMGRNYSNSLPSPKKVILRTSANTTFAVPKAYEGKCSDGQKRSYSIKSLKRQRLIAWSAALVSGTTACASLTGVGSLDPNDVIAFASYGITALSIPSAFLTFVKYGKSRFFTPISSEIRHLEELPVEYAPFRDWDKLVISYNR